MDMNGQAQIRCPKCKALVEIDTHLRKIYIKERPKNAS
jgi:phage FluMu protein Com